MHEESIYELNGKTIIIIKKEKNKKKNPLKS